jgi:hypothetical protein
MKRLLLLALLLTGCGGSPSAPAPVPTPIPYPNMVGGWAGSASDTWVGNETVTGSRVCNETWLITSQTGGAFSGAYQSTPGSLPDCARSGNINGSVLVSGEMEVRHSGSGLSSSCVLIGGGGPFTGVLSPAGNITAGVIHFQRCPFRGGTIDYRVTSGVTLSRR